jgi:hypothetical protein
MPLYRFRTTCGKVDLELPGGVLGGVVEEVFVIGAESEAIAINRVRDMVQPYAWCEVKVEGVVGVYDWKSEGSLHSERPPVIEHAGWRMLLEEVDRIKREAERERDLLSHRDHPATKGAWQGRARAFAEVIEIMEGVEKRYLTTQDKL